MRRLRRSLLRVVLILLFSYFLAPIGVSPATEKEILLEFKSNVSGDPGNALGSWDQSKDPCLDYRAGLKSLRILSLFGNRFTGNIPQEYAELGTLWKINLSTNALSGSIPEFIGDLQNIRLLDLARNGYTGEIPAALFKNCYKTKFISLSRNSLSGFIPASIANCSKLEGFDFSFNNLSGVLPPAICDVQRLAYLSVRSNVLTGSVRELIAGCQTLELLDLGSNMLNGSIPDKIGDLRMLTFIRRYQQLRVSSLLGDIPETIYNMTNLEILDLHRNQLNGSIPATLGSLSKLQILDLSRIHFLPLWGYSPMPKIQGFGSTAFFHNPGLCGDPLESCTGNGTASASRKTKLLTVPAIVAIVAAAVILTGHQSFAGQGLLIGGGSIGTVYKTTFEGGISIAVKKLEFLGRIRSQDEFEHEIGRLGNLQHPNLVAFQGYYWSSTMQLILSEFVPNGNLYDNLHGLNYPGTSTGVGNSELYWSRRFQIALGTARALAYLHHDCRPPILHLNIKSSNILLDEKYEAKLSDYGLGKLLPILDNYGLTKFHNALENELIQVMKLGLICTSETPLRRPSMAEVIQVLESIRSGSES
ncbi:putative LRR receptor-like serine/threonine-protein kinase [Vitis vinifera]|uniref:Putative LRR receptor-like serine/threonine-protein kinase n=1 Tax=Vitis vinifera TaxID=29760 RepID=A0A438ESJ8_VITVI|nr:putative LRR receptor-like serine/threonine-protein kinase [Vitis vinifera]